MQKIGKGLFSTVYRDGDEVIVKSSCWGKECNALWGYGDSELWPEIERLDYDEVSTYRMPFYEQPKSLKNALLPDQYELYKRNRMAKRMYKEVCEEWSAVVRLFGDVIPELQEIK